jgi:hypothetical protein
MIKTLPVTNKIVDCFTGEGWENWTRWFIRADGPVCISSKEPHYLIKKFLQLELKKRSTQ